MVSIIFLMINKIKELHQRNRDIGYYKNIYQIRSQ